MTSMALEYQHNATTMSGELFRTPHNARGYVLLLPEWWGLTDHLVKQAEKFSLAGYTALALDLYGGRRTAEDPQGATDLYGELMSDIPGVTARRVRAAEQALKQECGEGALNTALVGYCMGGTLALQLARLGEDFDAFVSVHGSYESDLKAGKSAVKGPVLICDGADDQLRSEESVDELIRELRAAGADFTFTSYPGAQHAFTNPLADQKAEKFGLPVGYSESAASRSWSDMTAFLDRAFA